ncbi:MAG: glycine cleavage system aminomethyltransferase GcvT [Myxococcota bacterium]
MTEGRRTPLHAAQVRLKARFVTFAGYEMPIQFSSIREEHQAVRERAGLFDVSHMGQLHFSGSGACATLEKLLTCEVDSLAIHRARYGLLLNQDGGCVDDVMLTRLGDQAYFLCVNASNIEKVHTWIKPHAGTAVRIEDRSEQTALLALQGPVAETVLSELTTSAATLPRRFRVAPMEIAGVPVLVSATGYTGAPGFELYISADEAENVFEAILKIGANFGVLPAGLGARDTLRIEAALPLYGHELDDTTTPFEAGLDRFVKPLARDFIGASALTSKADEKNSRCLVGFEMCGRGIARAGYPMIHDGRIIGHVTSGAPSPTLGKSIGLGYVPPAQSRIGQPLAVRIRDKDVEARVVERPFLSAAPKK